MVPAPAAGQGGKAMLQRDDGRRQVSCGILAISAQGGPDKIVEVQPVKSKSTPGANSKVVVYR